MPSQADFARKWILSRTRISQLVREGMPLTSYRAAERWRNGRPKTRAATAGSRKFAVEHEDGTGPIKGGRTGRPLKPRQLPKSGDSLLDALNAAIAVSERAYEEFDKAMCNKETARTSALLSVHNKSLEARFMAEKSYREEQERRNVLVDKAKIVEGARRTIEAILRRLKKLPQEKGPECNPENSLQAVQILEGEVNSIIATGKAALEEFRRS
jgi:hypothetical protein